MKALVGIFNKEKFLALQGSVVSPLTFQWDSPVLLCWVPFTPLGWCIRCHVSYISHNIYLRNLKSCKSLQNAMSNINLAFYNIWGLEHWSSLFIAPPWQIRHTNQKMEKFPHFRPYGDGGVRPKCGIFHTFSKFFFTGSLMCGKFHARVKPQKV